MVLTNFGKCARFSMLFEQLQREREQTKWEKMSEKRQNNEKLVY